MSASAANALALVFALAVAVACSDADKTKSAESSSEPATGSGAAKPNGDDGKPALGSLKAPSVAATLTLGDFAVGEVPDELKVDGKVFNGLRFADKNGENWVLFSKRTTSSKRDLGAVSEYLYVNHFAIGAGGAKKLRLVRDKVENCDLDLLLNVGKDSLAVTDLDEDGIGEVSFGYELACAGDISPATYKFLLLENGDKYIIRGSTKVVLKGTTPMGGDRKIDKSFLEGPAAFKDYAVKRWRKLIVRRLD